MTFGRPFKYSSTQNPNSLSTPDVLKFHVPVPVAFTPVNPENAIDKKTGRFPTKPARKHENLVSSGQYRLNPDCQTTVMNLNRCIKNIGSNHCEYYTNFLNRVCKK